MKFITIILIFTAFFAVVIANDIRPTKPRRCDYKCTQLDGTSCASNGICLHRFPSQCLMDKYNCLFPQKAFSKVDDWKCHENTLPLCTKGDL